MPLFSLFKKADKKAKTTRGHDIVQAFDRLTIAPRVQSDFVGGFHLNSNSRTSKLTETRNASEPFQIMPRSTRPRRPESPAFPIPHTPLPLPPQPPPVHSEIAVGSNPSSQRQSLTMRHAMYNPGPYSDHPPTQDTLSRPHTDTSVPLPTLPTSGKTLATKQKKIVVHSGQATLQSHPRLDPSRPLPTSSPSTPQKAPSPSPHLTPPAIRPRRSSTPASPASNSSSDNTVQCSGMTKAGKRCARQVKNGPPLSVVHPEVSLQRFCFQHTKDVMAPSGFFSRKTGEWVKFEDFIPVYLQHDTQAALRTEMERARSQSDVPGYIYTFEIRDLLTPGQIHLKVGRAVNLVKRLDQWDKQCGSKEKEQVVRGWWPGTIDSGGGGDSLMKVRINAGAKGPSCHRLERLIHLELADLVLFQPYLDPKFPNVVAKARITNSTGTAGNASEKRKCPQCGTTHKEIFSFKRVAGGPYEGKEWELIVQPVIARWGEFVDSHV